MKTKNMLSFVDIIIDLHEAICCLLQLFREELKGAESFAGMETRRDRSGRCVTVTGATGYIGSWLVRTLLQQGYTVHATLRDPAKSSHLLPLWNGGDRLRLFSADLQQEGSFDEAVEGCECVFHVAASMEFEVPSVENVEGYVQSDIIKPAVKGTLNVLKACLKSKSVKRVILTSSISTLTAKDSHGNWRPVVDESCQTPMTHIWNTKASGWVYALSKLMTEEAAFKFANDNGMGLVSVITATVAGPFLTPTVPSSIQVLLSPITGDPRFLGILCAVNDRMGSIGLVHVEDLCNAHVFLMEEARAKGRYTCCAQSHLLSELVVFLSREYRYSKLPSIAKEEHSSIPSEISPKKLRDLGFSYKYGFEDIVQQTVSSCVDHGFLPFTKKTNRVSEAKGEV